MPEASKNTLSIRAGTHSDVADTPASRARQSEMAERQLGQAIIKRLREGKDTPLRFANFQEEWHQTDDGLVLELSVKVEEAEAA